MPDAVNAPAHYTSGGIEAIDYIAAKLGPAGFRAYCIGNVLKYLSRWERKDGEQDLAKAQVYLGWAIAGQPARAEPRSLLSEAIAAQPELSPEEVGAALLGRSLSELADEE